MKKMKALEDIDPYLQGCRLDHSIWLHSFHQLDPQQMEWVRTWRNHPHIRQWLYNQEWISEEEHAWFFQQLRHDKHRFYWMVGEGERWLGVINLQIDSAVGTEWGFHLNPDCLGKGLDLLYIGLQFFLEELKIPQLHGWVDYRNTNALLLHDFFGIRHSRYEKRQLKGVTRCFSLRSISTQQWQGQKDRRQWQRELLSQKASLKRYREQIIAEQKRLECHWNFQ
ncbi:MAG: UDP-4-amino-4,6-dideoxy-N-acetyl-beta-L-altrosamine N-acetyltransferase [Bacteroidota bacterium]